MPRRMVNTPIPKVARWRSMPSSSSIVATAVSVRAMALVRAAKRTRRKNSVPPSLARPVDSRTLGIVMNIREGPALRAAGSPPEKANTAGMIIRPASMAMPVSKISTLTVALSMDTSSFI